MAIFSNLYRKNYIENGTNKQWYFLLLVLLGFGSIDILFKQVASIKNYNSQNYYFWFSWSISPIAFYLWLLHHQTQRNIQETSNFMGH